MVHREHQVVVVEPGVVELLGAVRGWRRSRLRVRVAAARWSIGLADVPVAGAAARDLDRVVEPGLVQERLEDDLGRGRAADVAQADQRRSR